MPSRDRIYLGTMSGIRRYTAKIIRKIERDKIDAQKGWIMIRALTNLHGMLKSELYPTVASGNTANILVTGELSPARRLVDELFGRRTGPVAEAIIQERLVEPVGIGTEPEPAGSPVGLREMPGSTAEP